MNFGVLAEMLASLTWRETLIAIIAVLVLYVLVAFLRMQRLKRVREKESAKKMFSAKSALLAYAADQTPALSPELPPESPPELPPVSPVRVEPEFAWNEPPPEIPGQKMIEALERKVVTLSAEVGALRAELSLVRETLEQELSQSRVTQNVSPIYSDAMQMAMQGHDATTISQHCGIARAEAELVVALVRNRNDGN
jgi:hypothetical protein